MKKTALILALMLLAVLTIPCATADEFHLPTMQEAGAQEYNDTYLGYSLKLPSYLYDLGEQFAKEQTEAIVKDLGPDDDMIYDIHYWLTYLSEEDYMMFSIQLKQSTYASFEEELAKAAEYADLMNAEAEAEGSGTVFTMIHDGIQRETPMGIMLETAYTYTYPNAPSDTMVVYYDLYFNTIEYCFVMEVPEGFFSYEELQAALDEIMQTVNVEQVISAS